MRHVCPSSWRNSQLRNGGRRTIEGAIYAETIPFNETRAFERLAITVDRFRRDPNRENRREALQLAGHGPLWSKYGAISGMFAAYRIEMALYGALPVSVLLLGQMVFWQVAPVLKVFISMMNSLGDVSG